MKRGAGIPRRYTNVLGDAPSLLGRGDEESKASGCQEPDVLIANPSISMSHETRKEDASACDGATEVGLTVNTGWTVLDFCQPHRSAELERGWRTGTEKQCAASLRVLVPLTRGKVFPRHVCKRVCATGVLASPIGLKRHLTTIITHDAIAIPRRISVELCGPLIQKLHAPRTEARV